jgi:Serine-pyruvate aminotransferase/archaeal aspartate aminotransferase
MLVILYKKSNKINIITKEDICVILNLFEQTVLLRSIMDNGISSNRILMGAGPSNFHPRVIQAMSFSSLGHYDQEFLNILTETINLLRIVYRTKNKFTIPLCGTGSAGMEACLVNFIEPGDKVVVIVNGVFSYRIAEIALRCSADLLRIDVPWGQSIDPDMLRIVLAKNDVKLVALVHVETSTGVLQPVEEISNLVHEYGALLMLDTVSSLGGIPVEIDKWHIDIAYSGTQKCLSAPAGLSPVTVSDEAMSKLHKRRTRVQSWFFDFTMMSECWDTCYYHYTAPVSMIYAFREALRVIIDEGLDNCFDRHRQVNLLIQNELEKMGLTNFVKQSYRAPMISAINVPEGIDELSVRLYLLNTYNVEIGYGIGQLKSKIWRIGTMGYSAQFRNVKLILRGIKEALKKQKL